MKLGIWDLKIALGLLRNAHAVMSDAGAMFHNAGESDQAAKIKEVVHRIADEIDTTDKALAEAERLEGGTGK